MIWNVTKYTSRREIENKVVVVYGYHQVAMELMCKMNFNAFPLDRQVWYDRHLMILNLLIFYN